MKQITESRFTKHMEEKLESYICYWGHICRIKKMRFKTTHELPIKELLKRARTSPKKYK